MFAKLQKTPFTQILALALQKFPSVDISIYKLENREGKDIGKFNICFSNNQFSEKFTYSIDDYYSSYSWAYCSKCYYPINKNFQCCSKQSKGSGSLSYLTKYIINLGLDVNNYTITFRMPEKKPYSARQTANSIFGDCANRADEGDWQINNHKVWSDIMIKCGGNYFARRVGFLEGPIKVDFNVNDYINLVYFDDLQAVTDIVELYKVCDYFIDERHRDWCVNWIIEKKDYAALRDLNLV